MSEEQLVPADVRHHRRVVDALRIEQREPPGPVRITTSPRRGRVPATLRASPHHPVADDVVLWMHGGSFVAGSRRSHERVVARMAATLGRVVVLVDYRLAPEHPFPAALDDARAAYDRLRAESPVVLGGDSAGGGIATALAGAVADPGGGLLLAYPLLDLRLRWAPSHPGADGERLRRFVELYRDGHPLDDPRLSPALGGVPEAGVIAVAAAEHDPLRAEASRFAARASSAGRRVMRWVEHGTDHAFLTHDEPARAVDATLLRFRRALELRRLQRSGDADARDGGEQRRTGGSA